MRLYPLFPLRFSRERLSRDAWSFRNRARRRFRQNAYEIVTKAGVLSTQPPLAVIYLDGNFPRPASLPTKEVEQKDLTFIPALLPIEVGTRVQFPNLDDHVSQHLFLFARQAI